MALGREADEETLDQSELRVWLDMSNQQVGLILVIYPIFIQGFRQRSFKIL